VYSYERRSGRLKRVITLLILIAVVSAVSIFVYSTYVNIDISKYSESQNTLATRLSTNSAVNSINTNTNTAENSRAGMLEDAANSVVGISKIKNTGSSILGTDGAAALGLGTGIIVSEDGYILTNWHVAGNRYSSCYVTLDDGSVNTRECGMGR